MSFALEALYVLALILIAVLIAVIVLCLAWPSIIDAVDKFVGFMLCLLIFGIG